MKIEDIAERLARALGHHAGCKFLEGKRCDLGCGKDQAEALDLYTRWKYEQTEEFKRANDQKITLRDLGPQK